MDNSFEAALREMRGGETLSELSEGLANLAAAVRLTGKAGKLILKLKVSPSKLKGACVTVEDEVETKLPKSERAQSLFFIDGNNRLSRNDPDQKEFDLKVVAEPAAGEVRQVKAV